MYIGDNEINTIYMGDNDCSGIYIGDNQIYPTTISGIKVNSALSVSKSGGNKVISVRSESNWELLTDASATWLTAISPTSGTSGRTQVSLTFSDNTGSAARTTTITARTTDLQYSATCVVRQSYVNYVSYIHSTSMSSTNPEIDYRINTGANITSSNFKIRMTGQYKGYYTYGAYIDPVNNGPRFFWSSPSSGYYDLKGNRLSGFNCGFVTNQDYDLTISNYQVYNNLTSSVIISGTTQNNINSIIKFCPGVVWTKQIQIWNDDVLIFDGSAATMDDKIGLWDSVSNTLVYNSDIEMSYEA